MQKGQCGKKNFFKWLGIVIIKKEEENKVYAGQHTYKCKHAYVQIRSLMRYSFVQPQSALKQLPRTLHLRLCGPIPSNMMLNTIIIVSYIQSNICFRSFMGYHFPMKPTKHPKNPLKRSITSKYSIFFYFIHCIGDTDHPTVAQ